jgi:uncharacterized protein YihD (DUF1040 family)
MDVVIYLRDIKEDSVIYLSMMEEIRRNPELKKAYDEDFDIIVGREIKPEIA